MVIMQHHRVFVHPIVVIILQYISILPMSHVNYISINPGEGIKKEKLQ